MRWLWGRHLLSSTARGVVCLAHVEKRFLGSLLLTFGRRGCVLHSQVENVEQLFVPLVRHAHAALREVKTWHIWFSCMELFMTAGNSGKGKRQSGH